MSDTNVPHVSGDSGSADIFTPSDSEDPHPTKLETQGHETLKHHKHRKDMIGCTDTEILKYEGADLPLDTHAGHVDIHGARK
jgi:hypothetical protein